MTKLIIKGCGASLPEKAVTNHDLESQLDTSHEWIVERTGIEQRHVAAEGEATSTFATKAAKEALKNAGIDGADVDLIVVATATPDLTFPSVACLVQAEIGANGCPAYDIQAACSGFIYALSIAEDYLRAGKGKNALVIGAETFTRAVDWDDRGTAVLFGDGAGAVLLQACEDENMRGLLGAQIHADGAHADLLKSSGGVSTTKDAGVTLMKGREVFKHAVRVLHDLVPQTLEKYGVKEDDISYLVPHQANKRIIEATAKMLNMPMDRVILTVGKHANTSAASIPLALYDGVTSGKIKKGDLLLLEAFGAGFTWGAAILYWEV